MRNLSPTALAKIRSHYGNEPVIILDIEWAEDSVLQYSEKSVNSIPGKILDISGLDNIITVSLGNDSQELSVTLDDTDGSIKQLMDTYDIQKKSVWVYQWFVGLDLSDRFLLFKGKINSPIVWKEGDRTVSFSIVSQLEDKEIGFSPEEGQFPFIPKSLIGKAWPMIFGTPLDVPAVRISDAVVGHLMCGVGIVSGTSQHTAIAQRIAAAEQSYPPDVSSQIARLNHANKCAAAFEDAARDNYIGNNDTFQEYSSQAAAYREEANSIQASISQTLSQWSKSIECAKCRNITNSQQAEETNSTHNVSCNPVTILGGEDFPRGNITLSIGGGGYIEGYFEDDTDVFYITRRYHPSDDESINNSISSASSSSTVCPSCEQSDSPGQQWDYRTVVPYPYGEDTSKRVIRDKGFSVTTKGGETSESSSELSSLGSSISNRQFWADAGSQVRLYPGEDFVYIVSIIPGQVLAVKAFKSLYGEDKLVDVPSEYYTVETQNYGSIDVVQIRCKQLSLDEEQKWSGEELYVTFESSIGPNIVDILEYLIETYSDLEIDSTSFDDVKIKLENFPANFAILDRKNLLSVLKDIAFQARCSLRLNNGVFYLKYLPEEPTSVDTLTESNIAVNSLEVSLSPTDDLVTKYTALWKLSYAQDEDDKIILRHNVEKYGIQEEEYTYYIYNQADIIHKVATFWLIRKSNTWKHISFTTFLDKLNIETFDAITLDFDSTYIASGSIKGEVESVELDTANKEISIKCWLPIKSGSLTQYPFAWPAAVSQDITFPLPEEIEAGYAGGNGIGQNATGDLPVGDTSRIESKAIFIGGPNIVFGSHSDWGDNTPTDVGFTPSSLNITPSYGTFTVIPKPNLVLSVPFVRAQQIYAEQLAVTDYNATEIILERTPIKSLSSPNTIHTLSELLKANDEDLAIKTTAKFSGNSSDGGCEWAPFSFYYDTNSGIWVSGAALYVDEEVTSPEDCEEEDV